MPAATAAAEPLDEPPGVWAGLCGFLVLPGWNTASSLAEDHRTRRAQTSHHVAVIAWLATLQQHRAALGRHVRGVDNVLDADRHAVQRPDGLARAAHLVGDPGLGQRMLRIEEGPRFDVGVDRLDTREAGLDQLFRGHGALADRFGGRNGGE
jgi:hypothetical protein